MKKSKLLVLLNLLTLCVFVILSGCGSDDDGDPNPQGLVTADAGDDQTVEFGEEVTFNGSSSTSSDGSSLIYLWEITNAPSGSAATLANDNGVNAIFLPDVSGIYTITLTVSNDNGDTDSDEVQITVEEATTPEEIGGTISEDRTLVDRFPNSTSPDYIASSNVNVQAELTIDPGVIIHFREDVAMIIESSDGLLSARGTSDNGIIFTSSDIANGLRWKGIFVKSAKALNAIDYSEVSFAGNSTFNFAGSDYAAGIAIENSAKLSINNSNIQNNAGYGLRVNGSGVIESFSSNNFEANDLGIGLPANQVSNIDSETTIENNTNAAVEIYSSTLEETLASTWNALNGSAAYLVSGNLTIDGDLTIQAGAQFELDENVLVSVNGSLIADGSSSDHVVFTSSDIENSLYWKGILNRSSSNQNSLKYVDISYAGNSEIDFAGANYAAGLGLENSSKITIENSSFTNNKDYGIRVNSTGQFVGFSDNTFENNKRGVGLPADAADMMDSNTTFTGNSEADVEIYGSNLDGDKDVTWNALNGDAQYRMTGSVSLAGDLTLAAGFELTADEDVLIAVDGVFIAVGTSDDPIVLTTTSTDINWRGLYIRSSSANNILDFVGISYAGNSDIDFSGANFSANVGVNSGAQLTITNSTISNSSSYGIYSKGTTNAYDSPDSNNIFSNNPDGNVSE